VLDACIGKIVRTVIEGGWGWSRGVVGVCLVIVWEATRRKSLIDLRVDFKSDTRN
jgi:rhamnogalacturonyl hydrolase YesR